MKQDILNTLKELKDKEYALEDEFAAYDFVLTVLPDIGHEDSYIRDGLIYPAIANIIYYDYVSKEEIKHITARLLSDDYLHYDLPNDFDNSVLKRSFSLLQLAVIIYKHRKDSIFTTDEFDTIYDSFMEYFSYETDFRGYLKEYGWAHSVAHSADVFVHLMQANEVKEDRLIEMFDQIKERFTINSYVYINDEDERMVSALQKGIDRDELNLSHIVSWIRGFEEYEKLAKYPEDLNVSVNIKNLLRSLYFRLHGKSKYQTILREIEDVSDRLNRYKK